MTDMALKIAELIAEGEKNGLVRIRGRSIEYLLAGRQYASTEEEKVRAALYVYLAVVEKVSSNQISIEHDRIDLGICDTPGKLTVLYECKAHCDSQNDLLAAQQQARAYAATRNVQSAFVAFDKQGELNIVEVPMKFEVPLPVPSPRSPRPITVSTINLKGGVGKTSLTCALAEFLSKEHEKKVLVIDLDPQTNATVVLMGEVPWKQKRDDQGLTLAHLFADRINNPRGQGLDLRQILVEKVSNIGGGINGLDLLPSSPHFLDIQDDIPQISQRRFGASRYVTVLQEALEQLLAERNYHYILIDCPPSLGPLTQNGLFISHYYLIPCVPDWLSTYGVPLIARKAWEFSDAHHRGIPCIGLVFCRYRGNVELHRNTVARYRALQNQTAGNQPNSPAYPAVFETIISETTRAEEAIEPDRSLGTLKQKYGYGNPPLHNQYANFAIEFLQRVDAYEKARNPNP